MGTFTIRLANQRDASDLHVLLTVKGAQQGFSGALLIGQSTPWQAFADRGATFSAEVLDGCRFYVGYGELPAAPDPNGTQYFGWIECSKHSEADSLWINLSSVDVLGLPLALNGTRVDNTPFSLGYRTSTLDLITRLKAEALTGPAPHVAVRLCSNGSEQVIAPNIQFGAYASLQPYLDELVAANAPLTIHTDTPTPASAKIFHGNFSSGDTSISLTDGTDTFNVLKSQLTTECIYRCDGGTVVYKGQTVKMNRPQLVSGEFIADAVYSNSLFRGLCTGLNEGYFCAQGPNNSSAFLNQKPFENGRGNVYAKIVHEATDSYGYPYADGNLKTLVQAGGSSTVTLTVLKDDETGFSSVG